jgi:hypothetical protein
VEYASTGSSVAAVGTERMLIPEISMSLILRACMFLKVCVENSKFLQFLGFCCKKKMSYKLIRVESK